MLSSLTLLNLKSGVEQRAGECGDFVSSYIGPTKGVQRVYTEIFESK